MGSAVGEWIDQLNPRDDSGRLIPPVVGLLIFGAVVFFLLAMVLMWASAQSPPQ